MARAHGLRGEVIVDLGSDRAERTAPGATFATDRGDLVLVEAHPHQGRWRVSFEGSSTREDAEALHGLVLWAEPLEDDETLWVHELIGCRVVDQYGSGRGEVVAVVQNPASDLLELDTGSLVPAAFVVGGPESGVVRVDVPEGLFEI